MIVYKGTKIERKKMIDYDCIMKENEKERHEKREVPMNNGIQ